MALPTTDPAPPHRDFIGPLVVMRTPEHHTLRLALRSLQSPVDMNASP